MQMAQTLAAGLARISRYRTGVKDDHLRLFRRSQGGMNAVPVHAAPQVRGTVHDLPAELLHYGEPELAVQLRAAHGGPGA